MPTSVPLTTKNPGDVLTSSLWNTQLKQNIDKLLNAGHRTLTVAQFGALTGLEGTKGVVAGDEVYLEVDATNGIIWHLVYESTETTYKWRFLGGPPLVTVVATAEATASATYVDLTTVGPSITLSRAGDYDIKVGAVPTTASAGADAAMSYTVGATASVDTWAFKHPANANAVMPAADREYRQAAVAAAATIKAQYRSNPGGTFSTTWATRRLAIRPVRLV